eukprot:11172470-Lingulodinium_polyedra.AAC.1
MPCNPRDERGAVWGAAQLYWLKIGASTGQMRLHYGCLRELHGMFAAADGPDLPACAAVRKLFGPLVGWCQDAG